MKKSYSPCFFCLQHCLNSATSARTTRDSLNAECTGCDPTFHFRAVKVAVLRGFAFYSLGNDNATYYVRTAQALCYSTAEYCAPVWARSSHASSVDSELNNGCRTITGCLRPTPLPSLYCLAGIAPPAIRRDAIIRKERDKQLCDDRHPLYGHQDLPRRLKSRNSFATVDGLKGCQPAYYRQGKRTNSHPSWQHN